MSATVPLSRCSPPRAPATRCRRGYFGAPRGLSAEGSLDGAVGLLGCLPLAVDDRMQLPDGSELCELTIDLPEEVTSALLVDDFLITPWWLLSSAAARCANRAIADSTSAVSRMWQYSAPAVAAAVSNFAKSGEFAISRGMITSRPDARCVRAIEAASIPPGLERVQKRSCHPPMSATTWSMSRFRTPGCSAANALATVDFPIPGGPFRWMNRGTGATLHDVD